MVQKYPYYLGGEAVHGEEELEVEDKFHRRPFAAVSRAREAAFEKAIQLALGAKSELAKISSYQKRRILEQVRAGIEERREDLVRLLVQEVGKPLRDSRSEVDRLLDTFRIGAEEVSRLGGEVLPLDSVQRGEGYIGFWKRFPRGVCAFITPFNFPLNLAAHKIVPALVAGCPFILKPAPTTPVSSLVLGEILSKAGLPKGGFSILPAYPEDARLLIEDDRISLLSFTGSQIGWKLKEKAGRKRVLLELGGNAAVVVDETVEDLEGCANRLVRGIFYQSGQVCISVQRVLIHKKIYGELRDKLVEKTAKLKVGDPSLEETDLGPMISFKEAERVHNWIKEAVRCGGKLLIGGERNGAFLEPTLLENVREDLPLWCEEAFGPVASLQAFEDFSEALAKINASQYGLQAGVFTQNLNRAFQAWEELDVGGVMINEVPAFRVDPMPYGGTKRSGLGREGIRWAVEEMTEIRLLVMRK
ncbi:MAG: aldehyde dehydrogenase family protein [Planctomycetota bacterium]|nr:MAG: aldehyde dehydrogenase family protein [Planctomycetota bacterium]